MGQQGELGRGEQLDEGDVPQPRHPLAASPRPDVQKAKKGTCRVSGTCSLTGRLIIGGVAIVRPPG